MEGDQLVGDRDYHIAMALYYSAEFLERNHNEQATKEAAEREWPSVVLEDVLDADEVKERTYFKPTIIGLTNMI